MSEKFDHIPLSLISPNPHQPRLDFNQEELKELAQSIQENGLIQPIIVRPSDILGYELIAGERRFRAAQMAGLSKLPAIVKHYSDQESMQVAIVENLQRSNLNPIEEAKAYQKLIERKQMTHDELAKYMGKSRPYISNMLRLLQLPQPILMAVEQEQISQGHARALLTLKQTEQQLFWLQKIQEESLSVRQVESALKNLKLQQPFKTKKAQTSDADALFLREQEKQLEKYLGYPVKITSNASGKGTIKIAFQSTEDFNNIVHSLK